MFEFVFLTLHPVFLSPFMAAFQGGFLRHISTARITAVLVCMSIFLFINTATGVFLSLLNRLSHMFSDKIVEYLHKKLVFPCIIAFHLLMYASITYAILSSMDTNENVRKLIIAETGDLLDVYLGEPSLMYISELGGVTRKVCIGFMIGFIILSICLLGCVVLFISSVNTYKHNSKSVSKVSSSLIVSSIVQAILCVTFLFIPFALLSFFWGFRIEKSANPINVVCVFMACHGTIDMFCILFFVKPYWRFVTNIGRSVKNCLLFRDPSTRPMVSESSGATASKSRASIPIL
uniref:G_PROTEIN_RECEP_F1_2 domain-containing protein n=1 Tax=Panagrellus redivivus TaxID=6233 RepID=A0A7E4ZR74_PANRE